METVRSFVGRGWNQGEGKEMNKQSIKDVLGPNYTSLWHCQTIKDELTDTKKTKKRL